MQPEYSDQYRSPHIFNSPIQGGDSTQITSQVSHIDQSQLRFTFKNVSINDPSEKIKFRTFHTPHYYSVDRCLTENPLSPYAVQFEVANLNALTLTSMPAHHLHLKVGAIIVLLINLNTSKSSCNGTRLIIRRLTDNLIEAETISGSNQGVAVGISRTRTQYKDKHPDVVSFLRLQFTFRIAFSVTITKAQGQTCERLGIDFSDEPFTHGQLYTALSRCTNSTFIRIFAPNKPRDKDGNVLIQNVVARGLQFD